jgi:hypothetical protein
MKPACLDPILEMVKFEKEKGHKLGVNQKKKKTHLQMAQMLMKASIPFKVG